MGCVGCGEQGGAPWPSVAVLVLGGGGVGVLLACRRGLAGSRVRAERVPKPPPKGVGCIVALWAGRAVVPSTAAAPAAKKMPVLNR